MSRSALITGATGFIGGELAKRLAASGWHVHLLVRNSSDQAKLPSDTGVSIHTTDETTERVMLAVGEAKPDVVFHLASLFLAGHRADQIGSLIQSNILFATQLAEACVAHRVRRFVNTGTSWQHFGSKGKPVNLYAATKQAFEDILLYYHDACDLSVISLDLYDTYGPTDQRRKLLRILMDAVRSGDPLGMSPGEQLLDLAHVDDVLDAYVIAADRLLASEAPLFERYLLSHERLTLQQLIAEMSTALGRDVPVRLGALPYRPREVMVPIEATSRDRLPGWTPRRTIGATIPEMMDQ